MSGADVVARGLAAQAVKSGDARARQRSLMFVGNRGTMLDTAAGGGGANNGNANYTRGESQFVFRNGPVAIRNLVLVFGNYALGPHENAIAVNNPITVEAAVTPVAASVSGQVARVTFGGKLSVSIEPDGEVSSDPIGIYIPPFAAFAVRTGVVVAAGQTWPTGYLYSASPEGGFASTAASSQIMRQSAGLVTPAGGASGVPGYGPVAVLGEMDAFDPVVFIIGDSLTAGGTGAALGNGLGDRGVIGYGLAEVPGGRMAYNKLARASEAAYSFQFLDRVKHRWRLAGYGTHGIVWLGTNDIGGRTVVEITGYLSLIYQQARSRSVRLAAITLPPRTTGTFASEAGQTPMAGWEVGGKRDQVNAWIKAQVGGLIDEVIDLNMDWESSLVPGTWLPNLTSDGTHPNEAGMQAGKARISAAAARWRR